MMTQSFGEKRCNAGCLKKHSLIRKMKRYYIHETRTECYKRNREHERAFGNYMLNKNIFKFGKYLENVSGN